VQNPLPFKLDYALRSIGQVFSQNLCVMFAKERSFKFQSFGESRKAQWKSRNLEITQQTIVDPLHGLALSQMRMVHRLLDAQYGRRRDTGLAQHLNRGLIAR